MLSPAWYDLAKLANKYVLEHNAYEGTHRFKEVYQIFSDVLGVPLKGEENENELLDEDIESL